MGWWTDTWEKVLSKSVKTQWRYKSLKCWQKKEIVQMKYTVADCDCVKKRKEKQNKTKQQKTNKQTKEQKQTNKKKSVVV